MEHFFQYTKNTYGLSDEAISLLEAKMEVVKISKGETFIRQGNRNNDLYFVSMGLVRCWFTDDVKEYSLNFAFEGELALFPLEGHTYSPVTAVAIEDSTLLRISQNELEELFVNYKELAVWGYRTVKSAMCILLNEYLNMFWMNKKKCYMKLVEKHPDILQRISLKDIASYFNITPSSLSRIRAEVKL